MRVVTQQGHSVSALALGSQQLLSTNPDEDSVDACIIRVVRDQANRHAGQIPNVERAVLVTGDEDMKRFAQARGVRALTGSELREHIFNKGERP